LYLIFFCAGNDVEWNGRWSDRDTIWSQIPSQDRQQLGQSARADGEVMSHFLIVLIIVCKFIFF
jgi:hypothetical protein